VTAVIKNQSRATALYSLLVTVNDEQGFFVGKTMAMRTVSIPIAECISNTKTELYAALRKSLDASRVVANIAATECLRQDNLQMEKCPKIYTYPACKGLFEGVSFMVSSVCRAVESAYKKKRWRMIRGMEASRSYRSQPWPMLNNKSCSTFTIDDEGEFLTCRIKLLDDWFVVRLAGGVSHRDQIKGLRRAIASDGVCDSKLWIDRKNKAIIGFSCDVAVAENKQKPDCEVRISSGVDYLLGLTQDRVQSPWVVNADEVILWKAESTRRNQRYRQSRKQGVDRRRLKEESKAFADKMARRLATKIHTSTSQIVDKAIKIGAARVKLDLTIKSFATEFPWYDLANKIKYKCESAGIEVIDATQTVAQPDCEKPHVYFAYDLHSHRVKIGRTQGGKDRLKAFWTMQPDLILLAVDNRAQSRLVAMEKHYHAYFDNHRVVNRDKSGRELFAADPVLQWLRAVGWLGNAGNLSQIMQVLDVSQDTSRVGHLQADSEHLGNNESIKVLAEGRKQAGINRVNPDGPRSEQSNE